MNRRNFLKSIAAGVTISLLPIHVWKSVAAIDAHIVGWVDKIEGCLWIRVTARCDGSEWHDLVRKVGPQTMTKEFAAIVAATTNSVINRSGLNVAAISASQVFDEFKCSPAA